MLIDIETLRNQETAIGCGKSEGLCTRICIESLTDLDKIRREARRKMASFHKTILFLLHYWICATP